MIAKEYQQRLAGDELTWDDAIKQLTERFASSGNRPGTLASYLKDLGLVRRWLKGKGIETTGPQDVTEALAKKWLASYATGLDERPQDRNAKRRQHSPHTVNNRLISLRSLWGKWFIKEMKIAKSNPWVELQPVKADKPSVKWVSDEQLEHFFSWLKTEYGEWEFPKLFFGLKAYTGCRLSDICNLKTEWLQEGCIIFPAGILKGRKERKVPLPPEMFARSKATQDRNTSGKTTLASS